MAMPASAPPIPQGGFWANGGTPVPAATTLAPDGSLTPPAGFAAPPTSPPATTAPASTSAAIQNTGKMITLEIGDKTVDVDAAFLSLSPQQQGEQVDQIGQQIGAKPAGPQDTAGGLARQVAIGTHAATDTILGAPVDAMNNIPGQLVNGLLNPAQDLWRALNGQPKLSTDQAAGQVGPIVQNPVGGSQWFADMGAKAGIADPNSPALAPQTQGERLARAGGEGVASMIVPEAELAWLGKLGIIGPEAEALAARMVGKSSSVGDLAKNAVVGGASAVGSQAAQDSVPDQYKPLAGMIGGLVGGGAGLGAVSLPSAARAVTGAAKGYLAPLTAAGRDQMAGTTLLANSSDPAGAISAISDARSVPPLVPGSLPTTGQLTGDMKLMSLERGVATKDPTPFMQRRADQNAAQTGAVENLAPTGAPEQVAAAVGQHIAQLDTEAQTANQAMAAAAQQKAAAIGPGVAPDEAGSAMQASVQKALDAVNAQKKALYEAIDPNGTLAISPVETSAKALETVKSIPASAKPLAGEEQAIYKTAASYGDTVPFSELRALQKRTTDEMANEYNTNGATEAYGRLSQLNKSINADLEKAIAGKVAQENTAVAAGQMSPADTTLARFKSFIENDNRSAAELKYGVASDSRRVSEGATSFGTARSIGSNGTAYSARGGLSGPSSDPRISGSGLEPNFDQAALDRLRTANAFNVKAKQTFTDNPTVGPIVERERGASGAYTMQPSTVPGKIFFPGPKSVDAIKSYRAAVGDATALPQLQEYAVDRVRRAAQSPDGTLDPVKLATWRRAHADALKAFPQLDASLADAGHATETMAQVAATQKASLKAAQEGALGRLIGLHDPQDITRTIGAIFGRQDAALQMTRLRLAIGGDKDALEGLKKAVVDHMVDHFVSNTEAGTSELGALKSDQLQNFITRNKSALRAAGFDDNAISTMEAVSADLQQANRSLTAVKIPGQSNTAQDLTAVKAGESPSTMLAKVTGRVAGPALLGIALHLAGGGLVAGIGTAIGAGLISAMRQSGLKTVNDIVKDALLNPERARMLMVKATPQNVRANTMLLSHMYGRAAVTNSAMAMGQR